jgi:hypothetical protein
VNTTFLKWMGLVGGTCLAIVIVHPRLAQSADHRDAPASTMEPAADINDVYAFMDGNNAVFAMTVSPAATAATKFSDAIQYVIRSSSGAGFGSTSADFNTICTFSNATPQVAQCWAGPDHYLTGDPGAGTGLTSTDGKVKIFAGVRKDPFFFNLAGFQEVAKQVTAAAPSLTFTDAGCPLLPKGTADSLVLQLRKNPDGGGAPEDFFKNLNTLAIVVSVDKALVTKGGAIVAVHGSTHRK